MNRCFLCGRKMIKVEGVAYELCSNEKCVRSKPLPAPSEEQPKKEDAAEE